MRLTPKFTTSFARAEKTFSYFGQIGRQDGFKVHVELKIDNPTPYTLELRKIGCVNYLLQCIGDFDTEDGYRALAPNKFHAEDMLIDAAKRKLYFFDAFIPNEVLIDGDRFPDIALTLTLLEHSDPSREKSFRLVRPVRPSVIIEYNR